jgi:hypothetical protein
VPCSTARPLPRSPRRRPARRARRQPRRMPGEGSSRAELTPPFFMLGRCWRSQRREYTSSRRESGGAQKNVDSKHAGSPACVSTIRSQSSTRGKEVTWQNEVLEIMVQNSSSIKRFLAHSHLQTHIGFASCVGISLNQTLILRVLLKTAKTLHRL